MLIINVDGSYTNIDKIYAFKTSGYWCIGDNKKKFIGTMSKNLLTYGIVKDYINCPDDKIERTFIIKNNFNFSYESKINNHHKKLINNEEDLIEWLKDN